MSSGLLSSNSARPPLDWYPHRQATPYGAVPEPFVKLVVTTTLPSPTRSGGGSSLTSGCRRCGSAPYQRGCDRDAARRTTALPRPRTRSRRTTALPRPRTRSRRTSAGQVVAVLSAPRCHIRSRGADCRSITRRVSASSVRERNRGSPYVYAVSPAPIVRRRRAAEAAAIRRDIRWVSCRC
jgi:hypothetical protein